MGNLTQTGQRFLDGELQSASSFDQPNVGGSTVLAGTLNVIGFADCHLAPGQSFKVLDGAPNPLGRTHSNISMRGFAIGNFSVFRDRQQFRRCLECHGSNLAFGRTRAEFLTVLRSRLA